MLGYLLYLNWQLTLVCFIAIPLVAYVGKALGASAGRNQARIQRALENISTHIIESVRGLKTAHAFNQTSKVLIIMTPAIQQEFSSSSAVDYPCVSSASSTVKKQKSGSEARVDMDAIKDAMRTILRAVGEDPDRDGLIDTPRRVAKMYAEMFGGLHVDAGRHLNVTFEEQYDEIILVRDIEFTSMCEHHLLPFRGVAHVAYIPNGRVTGLSKLARVVEDVSRRPQVQERMTRTIADLIEERLNSCAVAVIVKAEHSCMSIRGIRKPGSLTVTSSMRGRFRNDPATRSELMSLINQAE